MSLGIIRIELIPDDSLVSSNPTNSCAEKRGWIYFQMEKVRGTLVVRGLPLTRTAYPT